MPTGTAVVVPVKAFCVAKERLGAVLGAAERAALAERLASGVVADDQHGTGGAERLGDDAGGEPLGERGALGGAEHGAEALLGHAEGL
ncbi:MAG: hypothetical protein EBU70_12565, partial [Actinobacteria bacterium]|nr:hypothetical protein [Actinomycetota bacterium]